MKHTVRFGLIALLASVLVGCSALAEASAPVRILDPRWGAHVVVGQPVELKALVYPGYPVEYLQVHLWDVNSDYEATWRIDSPGKPEGFRLSELIAIPVDAPPGKDYRLEIAAFPGEPLSGNVQGAYGYSVKIAVEAPQ